MGLRLTERDTYLMRWINSVGFVTMDHISTWLNIAKPTAYGRIKKLVSHGYLLHERILHTAAGIYRVTLVGVQVSGSSLSPLRQVSLSSYNHTLKLTSLSIVLVKRYGGYYLTEREVRHASDEKNVGRGGHLSDGTLVLENKRIAIELELTKKGKRRRDKIFNHYVKNFDYQEVWYFCGNAEIIRHMEKQAEKAKFLKVFNLNTFLNEKEDVYA